MHHSMETPLSTHSEKPSKNMDSAAFCRHGIAVAAGPRDWADTRESWLARAARKLGLSYRRTKSIWYNEARVIRADEYLKIRAQLEELQRSAELRAEII